MHTEGSVGTSGGMLARLLQLGNFLDSLNAQLAALTSFCSLLSAIAVDVKTGLCRVLKVESKKAAENRGCFACDNWSLPTTFFVPASHPPVLLQSHGTIPYLQLLKFLQQIDHIDVSRSNTRAVFFASGIFTNL